MNLPKRLIFLLVYSIAAMFSQMASGNATSIQIQQDQTVVYPEVAEHQNAIRTTLQLTNPGTESQSVFLISSNSLVPFTRVEISNTSGDDLALERLDLQIEKLVYELPLKPGTTVVSILQSDAGSFLPDWTVKEPGEALKKLSIEQLLLTIGLTTVWILAIYQFGVFLISRDIGYLNLFAMLSTMGAFIFAHSGWGGVLFGWDRVVVLQLFFVTTAAALHFGSEFLDLKTSAPKSRLVISLLCVMSLVASGLLFVATSAVIFELLMLAVLCGFVLLQALALRLAWLGETRAKYYLAGVSLICLASIWAIASYLVQGYTTATETWGLLISICVSCLVWSVSYAHQLKEFQEKQMQDREDLLQARFSETKAIQQYHVASDQNKATSEFLATMSHEIRTPMNGVLGMAQALQDSELNQTQQSHLSVLVRSGRLLMVVLNDILDYSKYASGHIDLDEQDTDMVQLLDDSVTFLQHRTLQKNIGLYVYPSASLPTSIRIDRDRLLQILTNLVSNAIKFTDHGHVSLTAEFHADQNELEIYVRDTGIGISTEVQSRLFNRFTQAESGTQRKYGGTGLGLAIVKLLVKSMNGTVDVHSEIDDGSSFCIRIPISKVSYQCPYQPGELTIRSGDQRLLKQSRLFYQWMGQTVIEEPDESDNLQVVSSDLDQHFERPLAFAELVSSLTSKQPAKEEPPEQNLSLQAHLLVAEDNKVNQMVIRRLLETKFDCTYTLVENGQEAIETYGAMNGSFDCILMDCEMPVIDGYAAATAIRKMETQKQLPVVPIIALTAHVVESYRARALEVGMTGFVTKPIDQAALFSSLSEAMTLRTQNKAASGSE